MIDAELLGVSTVGEPDLLGDSVSLTELDPCKCPDTHETPSGECDLFLPEIHGKNRIRCEGCQRDTGWIHKGKAKGDRPPITVNIKGPSAKTGPKDQTKAKVAAAAQAWLGMAAVLLEATGDPTCAKAITDSAPQVAAQLAELSVYHPVIVKVLAPVEASGEVLAWISLVIAVSPVILAILAHHKLISPALAERFGVLSAMGAVVSTAPASDGQ